MPVNNPYPFRVLPGWRCLALLAVLLAACSPGAPVLTETLPVTILVDGSQMDVQVAAGSAVQAVLESAGVQINVLDRVDPPGFTLVTEPATIRVVRVREEFRVEENVIPFEHQTVRNESLSEGETLLIQPGVNGLQQVTYRSVFEDGQEVSSGVLKTVVLSDARPEIIMVGVQSPFVSMPLPGRLAYITAGNAWVMEETTGSRRPVVTSGDLDGRIFRLSPDGSWLLYTRKSDGTDPALINTLWAASLNTEEPRLVDLRMRNIIHYAGWVPGKGLTIACSTVEGRVAAPGWQANNDLQTVTFTATGAILRNEVLIEANSGGIYGWWGSTFAWSPDGSRLAYARPDSVGVVDTETDTFTPMLGILPLQTRADWAWVPGLAWSSDGSVLYTVNHATMAGMLTPEESPLFDVTAINLQSGVALPVVASSGMFAYPATAPAQAANAARVVYLQAIFPEQSESSNYRVMLMDRDGSNRMAVFPAEGSPGVSPQQVTWSPVQSDDNGNKTWLGIVYQGNLWFVQTENGLSRQISGDGSITRIDWQ